MCIFYLNFAGTPRSNYETSTLDRSPKKIRPGQIANSFETLPTMINNRHSTALTASGLNSPTTPTTDDYIDPKQSQSKIQGRKPVGGIAVLPPMEMKRIEEQRKTPTPTADSKLKSSTAVPEVWLCVNICFLIITIINFLMPRKSLFVSDCIDNNDFHFFRMLSSVGLLPRFSLFMRLHEINL